MKYFCILCFSIYALTTFSQVRQNHFVYLQTENKQPFYVKINREILSSTSFGYLIVPKLSDSTYQFSIGFPAKEWPEQMISLPIKKDLGFLLKNFDGKGWGLFNLQTFEIVMNQNDSTIQSEAVALTVDQFSSLLSQVVNDSSIKQTNQASISKTLKNQDSIAVVSSMATIATPDTQKVIQISPVKKLSAKSGSEYLEFTYTDEGSKGTDTVVTIFYLNEELSTGRVNDSVTSIAASILNTDLKDTITNNKALSKDNKPDQQSIISVQPTHEK